MERVSLPDFDWTTQNRSDGLNDCGSTGFTSIVMLAAYNFVGPLQGGASAQEAHHAMILAARPSRRSASL